MHRVEAKGILSASNGMNLYRGCSHGCIYCDARSTCYQMKHDFEDIEVKERYIARYGNAYEILSPDNRQLMEVFKQVCGVHGIVTDADL